MKKMLKKLLIGSISLVAMLLFLPSLNGSAHSIVTTIPKGLRGTWYTYEKNKTLTKYVFTKKTMTYTATQSGRSLGKHKVKVVKKFTKISNNPKYVTVQKQKHGWYGLTLDMGNGIMEVKRATYKMKGHKYPVLYVIETGAMPKLPKKMMVHLAFHHNYKKVHDIKVVSQGMYQ